MYTLAELHTKMTEFSGDSEVYTIKRLKQKLQEHYKEFIFFAEVDGRSNIVCFRNMAKYIINDKWYSEKRQDIDDEAKRIVEQVMMRSIKSRGGRGMTETVCLQWIYSMHKCAGVHDGSFHVKSSEGCNPPL